MMARIDPRTLLATWVVVVSSLLSGCGGDGACHPTPAPPATATASVPPPTTPVATPTATPPPPPTATATPAVPSPTGTPAALCAERSGGALITFAICERTLTVWSTAPAFIDEAQALLESGGQRIPSFETLLDGTDCDRQWTWHVDPMAMSFVDFAIELCDGCPFHIEDDKPYWLETVGQYCPWSARVIAVDERRSGARR